VQKNYPFDAVKKNSSVILKTAEGKFRRFYKGAGEQIFGRATHIMDTQGHVHDLAPRHKVRLRSTATC